MFPLTRVHPAARVLVAGLAAALLLAAAAPASAVTRKQATSRALAALGSSQADGPVVVFALPKPVAARSRVTQGRARLVLVASRERARFFYQDAAPGQPYPHPGRVALVGVRSGKVRVSRTIMLAPRVNGRLPAFLRSRAAYGSSRYRVFELSGSAARPAPDGGGARVGSTAPATLRDGDPLQPFNGESYPPVAFGQDLVVKQNVSKRVTLTGSDANEDPLTFQIVTRPRRGKLSGQPPNLVYTPVADYLGPDQFTFTARDDEKDSEPAVVTLNVVPLGEPPSITASPGCTSYTEHGRPVPIDREMVVSDPDDKQLDRATVRIADGFQDGDDLLLKDQNGISSSYDAGTGVLSLVGSASVDAYLAALRSVSFRSDSSRLTKTKYIQFVVNDAGLDSVPATKAICIAALNDPPIGENGEGGLVYVENDGPVPVDGSFVVGDPDSSSLSGATIEFVPHVSQPVDVNGDPVGPPIVTHTFAPAEDRLAFRDQSGITGAYDDVAGVLRLSGLASLAAYEAAIRSVTYENTSEDPSDATRRLQFQVTDSKGASSVPVRRDAFITAVNDEPRVIVTKGWTWYTGKPTLIDPGLTALDVDDDLEAAVVRIADGFVWGDMLEYTDEFGIGGDYDREKGVLTLKGRAPASVYEAALRSIAYSYVDGATTGARAIEFVTYDGELESAPATKIVDPSTRPVVETSEKPLAYTVGSGFVPIDDAITVRDPDSELLVGGSVSIARGFVDFEDELLFKDQNGIFGEYDDGTGVLWLKGEATVADYEAALRSVLYENSSEKPSEDVRTVVFQVDDGSESSDAVSRDIEITPP
ncbi:MAG TPA: Ig-like domain-containing protein [Solirubrobacteraceae bacterium]